MGVEIDLELYGLNEIIYNLQMFQVSGIVSVFMKATILMRLFVAVIMISLIFKSFDSSYFTPLLGSRSGDGNFHFRSFSTEAGQNTTQPRSYG